MSITMPFVRVPLRSSLRPPSVSRVCARAPCAGAKSAFQKISISDFAAQFLLHDSAIQSNKRLRFTQSLKAAADGTMFERPVVNPGYVAHLEYHSPPIWGRLQSSYDDVKAELNIMRSKHLDKRFLFVGGDGLSILRVNHLLHNHPELYIDSSPMVIPVQGESPHGLFHVMHGGWRLFKPFIRAAADAALGSSLGRAVVDDPLVSNFNTSLFALWWMTRACSEYLLHLASTPGACDIDVVPEFIAACERNIDLAWVVHFLYDFAYLVLDFKQAVRANRSHHLDLLWREFFATGYTSTANKTQYVPMAIMRVFWAQALVPKLAHLYHNLRAIPMSARVFVGWDTPIEWLNGAISDGIRQLVSEARIEDFVFKYSLVQHNYTMLLDGAAMKTNRRHHAKMRAMDGNVAAMKAWLMKHVGADWHEATSPNSNSKLGMQRARVPWDEMREAMNQRGQQSVTAFVAKHVRGLTSSYYSFAA